MIVVAVIATTLVAAGIILVILKLHRRLTPTTAVIIGISALAIVAASIAVTVITACPDGTRGVQRGYSDTPLIERVLDVELPLPQPLD